MGLPRQVANAWRATRREGAVILSTPSMLRTLGSRPKFAVLSKDQVRNAQVRDGRDWWACPAKSQMLGVLLGGGAMAVCYRYAKQPMSQRHRLILRCSRQRVALPFGFVPNLP